MFLWCKFFIKEESDMLKNLLIIFIGSLLAACINITNINPISSYLIVILLIKFIYKRNLIRTSFEFAILLCFVMILQLVSIYVFEKSTGKIYSGDFLIEICIGIGNSLLITIFHYFASYKKKHTDKIIESKAIYYFSINVGIYIVISKLIWVYDYNFILNNLEIYIICLMIIFLLQIYLYFHIVKITEEKKILEVQNGYIPIINNTIEELKRKQHDFKNQINTINGIIEVSDEKQIKSKLKEYMKVLIYSNKDTEGILYINNIIIKAILYNAISEAEKLNIKFIYKVSNTFSVHEIEDYELSDIINNLLNNAFEAVQMQENDTNDKLVIINILNEDNKNVIEVKNNGIPIKAEDINKIFKRGFSTKNGECRGYGLYNVKKTVEHNNGEIQLFFQDEYTVFKVLF
jgi:two-component system sensor histidine kinase AgrC